VPPVVEAIDLHRTYRTTTGTFRRRSLEVEAVRGVSFAIEEGELFGLLGPNGAGKTTTIKMLITLLIPTSGQARVLGRDVVEDARWVRERIGYVFGGDRGPTSASRRSTTCATSRSSTASSRAASGRGSRSCSSSSGCRAARRNGSRATRGACASGSTSPAGSCTTRR
jgi:hypothetical protein